MAGVERHADAVWIGGDLRTGHGEITTGSGVLKNTAYTFVSRFEHGNGTNPEELLAAAHAGCYSMALNNTLYNEKHPATEIKTRAEVTLDSGKITKITLHVEGKVAGLDQAQFVEIAKRVESTCIVSAALRSVPIDVEAKLIS